MNLGISAQKISEMFQVFSDFYPELMEAPNAKVPSPTTVQRARKAMEALNEERKNAFVADSKQLVLMVDQSPSLDGNNMNGLASYITNKFIDFRRWISK